MFTMKVLPTCILICFFLATPRSRSQEVLQWRGADRTGLYNETGLLPVWPDGGPSLLWECDKLGNGYGSPVITRDRIFVNGELDTVSYLFALSRSGEILWKTAIGKEWTLNYPGSRSTPTVVDSLIYVTAGMGAVACINARTGKMKWSADLQKDFHGRLIGFGFSESVPVNGDLVYCSPGGADTNVVALDRFSGKIRWISKGMGEETSYCSPLLIRLPGKEILVTFSKSHLLGIDAGTGALLWSHKQNSQGDVHANTPWFEDGFIYYIAGDGNGSVKLELAADGLGITEIWRNKACDDLMGGFIKLDGYIYTASYGTRQWYIQDANTGALVDSVRFDKGTTNYADGLLYLYNEKGQVGLFKPAGPKMDLVSSFKVTRGTKAHYAHPVINQGILYIRHGKSLLAYNIRNSETAK